MSEEPLKLSPLSRRSFLTAAGFVASSAWLHPSALLGQAAQAQTATDEPAVVLQSRAAAKTAKITTHTLRGGVSVLQGSGGNIAVLTAKAGKLLVDSGFSTSRPQITEALAAIGPDPIRILINTHWHYDHTDGNEWVHSTGASIWAHENTRFRMASTQTMAAFHATFLPAPTGALPTVPFNDTRKLSESVSTLLLTHYEPAHTDTDISVYFTEADVLHTGDTWFNGFYPFIDYSTGGNIDGMIRAAERNLATATDRTIIIPGHGPIGSKGELTEYRDILVLARDRVAAMKKQGKSLPEIVAGRPMATYDPKWGAGFMAPDAFLGLVYQGV